MVRSADIRKAARIIREGGIVAFPTETVYGLGANALDAGAARKVFVAKGRPADNPFIVHVADEKMLKACVKEVPPAARMLMRRFWPGPLTIVLKRGAAIPDTVTAGLPTVGVRMPDHPVALALIRAAGVPIAAPSANKSGRPSPTRAAHVRQDFPRLPVLDGGPATHGLESTVISLVGRPTVLRQGAVTLETLRAALPGIRVATRAPKRPASPGMKYRHYAPDRPLLLFRSLDTMRRYAKSHPNAVVLCKESHAKEFPKNTVVALGTTDEEIARRLYAALRTRKGEELLILAVPKRGAGRAIMDRLERAATRKL